MLPLTHSVSVVNQWPKVEGEAPTAIHMDINQQYWKMAYVGPGSQHDTHKIKILPTTYQHVRISVSFTQYQNSSVNF